MGVTENFGDIQQIIPATGWEAVYTDEDGTISTQPVACWALVEWKGTGQKTTITGMVADPISDELTYASLSQLFLGFKGPGENLKGWDEVAKDQLDFLKKSGQI